MCVLLSIHPANLAIELVTALVSSTLLIVTGWRVKNDRPRAHLRLVVI